MGPLFGAKDGCAYVQVRKDDSLRAVVDLSTMTLVDYVTPDRYPHEQLRCDQSVFVPIFCPECYGTQDCHYKRALETITSEDGAYVVGMCSVYGVSTEETYPDSRQEYIVPNDLAFAGACHPMPGKALFMHKAENDIGFVKCYWHVHSRSSNKTFLYCCVARANTDYARGVVKSETNMGFSLGTTGDNSKGPITDECSLVSWPMRPGCFCVLVCAKDLSATMNRMGFSVVKNRTLDAGATAADDNCVTPSPVSREQASGERGNANSMTKMLSDQLAEIRVLKDMLEAVKVQNNLFTRLLKGPDQDALFTLRGAKDFSRRTGVETKLCAGDTDEGLDNNKSGTCNGGMAATQAQIEELLKLLQKQQQQPHQPQPYDQHLYGAHGHTSPQPFYLPYPHMQLQNPAYFYQGNGLLGFPSSNTGTEKEVARPEPLTAEQRKEIAMVYNREEADRHAVAQKQQDQMMESIKASIRDALKDHRTETDPIEQRETLRLLARDTPYKRNNTPQKPDNDDIAALIREVRELREMTKDLSSTRMVPERHNATTEPIRNPGTQTVDMETEPNNTEAPAASEPRPQSKQQAGYASASQAEAIRTTKNSVADFISAVVSKN